MRIYPRMSHPPARPFDPFSPLPFSLPFLPFLLFRDTPCLICKVRGSDFPCLLGIIAAAATRLHKGRSSLPAGKPSDRPRQAVRSTQASRQIDHDPRRDKSSVSDTSHILENGCRHAIDPAQKPHSVPQTLKCTATGPSSRHAAVGSCVESPGRNVEAGFEFGGLLLRRCRHPLRGCLSGRLRKKTRENTMGLARRRANSPFLALTVASGRGSVVVAQSAPRSRRAHEASGVPSTSQRRTSVD